jgi:hypothetical protein
MAMDLKSIAALADVEPVRSTKTPLHLEYQYTAGEASSRFLRAMKEKRITGQRCPVCQKVYIPPRGACPTVCVVNVQFYGQVMQVPYISALVLVDGSDIPLFGLVQDEGFSIDDVRMGLRVEAVWAADEDLTTSLENILYWRPTGEPDADYESYKEHV